MEHIPRIDVHHHAFFPTLGKGDASATAGYRVPAENLPWTPEVSLKAMDALGIDLAVLSLPTGFPQEPAGLENRSKAREFNLELAQICKDHPGRFGFFASLPLPSDAEGALEEIAFALDELHADGIALDSSYGRGSNATYIGDDVYDPVWKELDRRGAVVFLHGTQTPSTTPWPHESLGIPITEVPNETYKAAAHLVVTGKKRRFWNVKIILAHLGGSTFILAPRVAVLSRHMGSPLTQEEIMEDFKSFHCDTALAGYDTNLALANSFVGGNRILFGTDFPAVSKDMIAWYSDNTDVHYQLQGNPLHLEAVLNTNALEIMPTLRERLSLSSRWEMFKFIR